MKKKSAVENGEKNHSYWNKERKKRLKRDLIELYNGIDCTHKRIYSINHLLFHEIK